MRRTKLVDCNPRWGVDAEPETTADKWVSFDCPEGHEACRYVIPFTPAMDGTVLVDLNAGARWERTGDTFETLSLTPSIRGVPEYDSLGAAIVAGLAPERVHPRMHCHAHFFLTTGEIWFCGDSR
jgi:hypothetical protein